MNPTWDLDFRIEYCVDNVGVEDWPKGIVMPRLRLLGSNPARRSARFEITLGLLEPFAVTVLDIAGRHVATLAQGLKPAGRYEIRWDGQGEDRAAESAGVYVVRLETPSGVAMVRVPLLR